MIVAETERLSLRYLQESDAAFILALLNQPAFLRFVGDKGVRTIEDGVNYIRSGPISSYTQNGFGLFLVELKEGAVAIGTCGILKKPTLTHHDIGYAFLPQHWGHGYAHEAAAATLEHARDACTIDQVCAVVDPENHASIKLLRKLGMQASGRVQLPPDDKELELFEMTLRG
jgi:RimJ/RimL family protein N-acetyltransferase